MSTEKKTSRVGSVFRSIFNFKAWVDYERLKSFTVYLWTGAKKMIIPDKVVVKHKKQSFRDAVNKMDISEAQLTSRAKGLYRLSLLMVLVAGAVLVYLIYHLIALNIKASIVSFVLVILALTLAFRYHFWYYQIKEHKLGCSFKEWYVHGLLGKEYKQPPAKQDASHGK